jgi:hypothetical protein
MAREVTLQELQDWIEKNKHRTWNHSQDTTFEKRTLECKYIRFSLDTTDMKIFHIDVAGLGNSSIHFRDDDKDWSVLDLLDSKLVGKTK